MGYIALRDIRRVETGGRDCIVVRFITPDGRRTVISLAGDDEQATLRRMQATLTCRWGQCPELNV